MIYIERDDDTGGKESTHELLTNKYILYEPSNINSSDGIVIVILSIKYSGLRKMHASYYLSI